MLVSLAGQEQQLQPQMAIGSVSPRSAEQGVDIMQMLTKAQDDYDKVLMSSFCLAQVLMCFIYTRCHQCTVHFSYLCFLPYF